MNDGGAFRGVVMVGLAVVIGLVLLSAGFDDSEVAVRTAAEAEGDDNVAPDDGDDSVTTETVPSALDPSAIPVIVANGSGVSGAAGAVTEQLTALGYNPGAPTDATSETAFDTVYFLPNAQDQAEQVATDLGLGPEAVQPMPTPPPADQAAIGLAQVLVVLGTTPGGLAEQATAGAAPAG
jgi:hypothetical protein